MNRQVLLQIMSGCLEQEGWIQNLGLGLCFTPWLGIRRMYLVPQMATAVVFFIYMSYDGMEQANAQYYNTGLNLNREIRICGPILTNTLELVCHGRFNSVNKKAQDSGTRSHDWTNNDRENFAIFPFRSRRNALAFNGANTFRRRTRNVADECCYLKSCTLAEMSHYCERNN